jgi:hypothetical protein
MITKEEILKNFTDEEILNAFKNSNLLGTVSEEQLEDLKHTWNIDMPQLLLNSYMNNNTLDDLFKNTLRLKKLNEIK